MNKRKENRIFSKRNEKIRKLQLLAREAEKNGKITTALGYLMTAVNGYHLLKADGKITTVSEITKLYNLHHRVLFYKGINLIYKELSYEKAPVKI